MAKLTNLPSLEIIDGFKKTIDYYLHDGVPCARSWPRSPGHRRAPAVQDGWPAFTFAASYWKYLSNDIKDAYNQMAVGTKKTGRDIFTQAYISGENLYLEEE